MFFIFLKKFISPITLFKESSHIINFLSLNLGFSHPETNTKIFELKYISVNFRPPPIFFSYSFCKGYISYILNPFSVDIEKR